MPTGEPAVEYLREGGWLLVRCSPGTGGVEWLLALLSATNEHLAGEPASAVLIDAREVSAVISTAGRFRVGERAAASWFGPPLALVGAMSLVDPERFGEEVARSRGLDVRVFTDIDEATNWLRTRAVTR